MPPTKLSLAFYSWYAWIDLTDKDARRSTTAVIGTLAAVQALAILMLGLTLGYGKAQELRIAADPLALCLFAGSRMRPDGITDDILAKLTERAEHNAPGTQIFPLERTWLSFEFAPETQPTPQDHVRMSFKGRTIQLHDPILRSYGVSDDVATRFGVVITPAFLDEYGSQSRPKTLVFHANSDDQLIETVPVLGVTSKDLPDGYRFLIGEQSLARLENKRPATVFLTGRVPEPVFEWRRWTPEQVQAMRDALTRSGVQAAPDLIGDFDPGQLFWRLRVAGSDGLGEHEWNSLLIELVNELQKVDILLPNSFVDDAQCEASEYEASSMVYDSVELLAPTTAKLARLGDVLRELQLPYDQDIVDQLVSVTRITQMLSALLGLIAVLVSLCSAYNIHTILAQRAEHKASEVGMLQAIGMTSAQLWRLYFVEGCYLWMGGAMVAMGCALTIGSSTQWIWNAAAGETMVIFQCPAWLLLVTLALSGMISMTCSVWASSSARSASPAKSLSVTL